MPYYHYPYDFDKKIHLIAKTHDNMDNFDEVEAECVRAWWILVGDKKVPRRRGYESSWPHISERIVTDQSLLRRIGTTDRSQVTCELCLAPPWSPL